MKRPLITPVEFSEMYVQPGTYCTKFVLDPRKARAVEVEAVTMTDADGRGIVVEFRRWGTKLHVSFTIDEMTPDGVALLDFSLSGGSRERFKAWVVKP